METDKNIELDRKTAKGFLLKAERALQEKRWKDAYHIITDNLLCGMKFDTDLREDAIRVRADAVQGDLEHTRELPMHERPLNLKNIIPMTREEILRSVRHHHKAG